MALLEVSGLSVELPVRGRAVRAVDGLDLHLEPGEVLGVVGESGSGKTLTALAVMGLLAEPVRTTAGRVIFEGRDLGALRPKTRRALTGSRLAMVFQEPATSLNPCIPVGRQVEEVLQVHTATDRRRRRSQALALLDSVGIPDPERRYRAFPHQLSGGMKQRAMIAMAVACNPSLLIADEPTTALDVTIQAQILELITTLQRERAMAMMLITHDLGVVAQTADRVAVMYAGQIVETGTLESVFAAPRHPYTAALIASVPDETAPGVRRLPAIPGMVPALDRLPGGCRFHPRCPRADARCRAEIPALSGEDDAAVRCHHPLARGEAP
jgi:dipeptide transport system ATP-binding protein